MLTWSSFQAAVTTGHCLNATEVFVASVESPFFLCVYVCVAIFDANALKVVLLSLAFRPSFFHMLFCFPQFHFIAKKNLGVWGGGGLYIRQAYFRNRIFRQLVWPVAPSHTSARPR